MGNGRKRKRNLDVFKAATSRLSKIKRHSEFRLNRLNIWARHFLKNQSRQNYEQMLIGYSGLLGPLILSFVWGTSIRFCCIKFLISELS